jgi:hypothetical protein
VLQKTVNVLVLSPTQLCLNLLFAINHCTTPLCVLAEIDRFRKGVKVRTHFTTESNSLFVERSPPFIACIGITYIPFQALDFKSIDYRCLPAFTSYLREYLRAGPLSLCYAAEKVSMIKGK